MGKTTIPVSELINSMQSQSATPTTVSSTTEKPVEETTQATPTKSMHISPSITPTKIKMDKNTRTLERVRQYLDVYLTADIGSRTKIKALQDVTELVYSNPKKNILDTVYRWFFENRNSEALNPRNAMQGLQNASPSTNMRVRILYQTMNKLTTGDKNLRLNLDTIQSILGEEFAAWVSVKLETLKHRRH